MTFDEAKKKKSKMGDTYTDKDTGIEFELIIVPSKKSDQDKYWKFITENMDEFEDDDAKAHSSNADFTIWSIGTDDNGLLFFNDIPID